MERYSRFLIQLICAMGAKISNRSRVAVFSTRNDQPLRLT